MPPNPATPPPIEDALRRHGPSRWAFVRCRDVRNSRSAAAHDCRAGRAAVFALNEIPSPHAHVGAIIAMASALNARGFCTTLYMLKSRNKVRVDAEGLGLGPEIRLSTSIGSTRFSHLLSLTAWLMIAAFRSHQLVLTRSSLVALFARRSRLVLLELHQNPIVRPLSMKFDRLILRLLRSDRVKLVVITERLRNRIMSDFPHLPSSRFVVAPSGFRSDWYPEQWEPSPGHGRIAYVGSLYPGRGIDVVVELARRLPEVEVLVIGGSIDQWASLLDGSEAPRNCVHHPHVLPGDVPDLLSACDVLLAPYQQKVLIASGQDIAPWMSPLKLVEYLAAGRAIVASDLPMVSTLVSHGVDGVLIDPLDVDGWASAVQGLLADAERRNSLARSAHRAAHGALDWDSRLERILAAFRWGALPSDASQAPRRANQG